MNLKKLACVIGAIIGTTILYNEFLVYYLVLFQVSLCLYIKLRIQNRLVLNDFK